MTFPSFPLSGAADYPPMSMFEALPDLTGLQFCVDVGDAGSLASAVANTPLLDLSSAGNDMIAGTAAGSDGQDPAFSGTIGAVSDQESAYLDGVQDSVNSEVYSFAGQPSFINTMHKVNAAWTIVFAVKLNSSGAVFCMGNSVNQTVIGFDFYLGTLPSTRVTCRVVGTGGNALNVDNVPLVFDTGVWLLGSIGIDDAGSAGLITINTASHSFDGSLTSPSSSNAGRRFSFGSTDILHGSGAGQSIDCSFAAAAIFTGRMLELTEINAIRARLNARFHFGI